MYKKNYLITQIQKIKLKYQLTKIARIEICRLVASPCSGRQSKTGFYFAVP